MLSDRAQDTDGLAADPARKLPALSSGEARTNSQSHWWVLAWLVVAAYTGVYAWQISKHSAVPYWDQTNYVRKVYSIADRWEDPSIGVVARLSPKALLATGPSNRPPLLMLPPAVIWGSAAQPQQMAMSWLLIRMMALVMGVWILSRVAGTARWAPAALCLILGRQDFLKINQNLYLMDLQFSSFGLLVVSLVIWAVIGRTATAAGLAALSGVALTLIKPQGLPFVLPLFALLLVERLQFELWPGQEPRNRSRSDRLSSLGGLVLALATMAIALLYLMSTDYWTAVRAQWELGQRGFWTWRFDAATLWAIVSGVLPPWLLASALGVALLGIVPRFRVRRTAILPMRLWIMLGVFVAWWLVFSLGMAYAVDPRVVWSIAPVTTVLAMMFLCRGGSSTIAFTTCSVGLFALSLGISAFGWPNAGRVSPGLLLGPPVAQQTIVADVGIRTLVTTVDLEVRKHRPLPLPVGVLVLTTSEYVDYEGMNLAARWANNHRWSTIRYEPVPFGATGFDFSILFGERAKEDGGWFLTKEKLKTIQLAGDAFVDLLVIESLVEDPASPLRSILEPVAKVAIRQPIVAETHLFGGGPQGWLDDSVTLWRRVRAPSPAETYATLALVEPRYRGKPGHDWMVAQLAEAKARAR